MSFKNFLPESELHWQDLGGGLSRMVTGYDESIMSVKVKFAKGAIGALHHHFHSQCSYVASGSFEVEIKGVKRILHAGDCFYIEPDAPHGVVCLEEGVLIDSFTPAREDFLVKGEG